MATTEADRLLADGSRRDRRAPLAELGGIPVDVDAPDASASLPPWFHVHREWRPRGDVGGHSRPQRVLTMTSGARRTAVGSTGYHVNLNETASRSVKYPGGKQAPGQRVRFTGVPSNASSTFPSTTPNHGGLHEAGPERAEDRTNAPTPRTDEDGPPPTSLPASSKAAEPSMTSMPRPVSVPSTVLPRRLASSKDRTGDRHSDQSSSPLSDVRTQDGRGQVTVDEIRRRPGAIVRQQVTSTDVRRSTARHTAGVLAVNRRETGPDPEGRTRTVHRDHPVTTRATTTAMIELQQQDGPHHRHRHYGHEQQQPNGHAQHDSRRHDPRIRSSSRSGTRATDRHRQQQQHLPGERDAYQQFTRSDSYHERQQGTQRLQRPEQTRRRNDGTKDQQQPQQSQSSAIRSSAVAGVRSDQLERLAKPDQEQRRRDTSTEERIHRRRPRSSSRAADEAEHRRIVDEMEKLRRELVAEKRHQGVIEQQITARREGRQTLRSVPETTRRTVHIASVHGQGRHQLQRQEEITERHKA